MRIAQPEGVRVLAEIVLTDPDELEGIVHVRVWVGCVVRDLRDEGKGRRPQLLQRSCTRLRML